MFRAAVLATVVLVAAPAPATRTSGSDLAGRTDAATVSAPASPVQRAPRRPAVHDTSARRRPPAPSAVTRSDDVERPWSSAAVPTITVVPDDAAHRERVRRAVGRYESAGLRLPDLHIEFSDDGCYGHFGVFERSSSPWQVSVCSDLEFVLTHELGHAWVAATLDRADRDAYVEFRDLPAWSSPDLHWRERGTEDAAFVLQRVLMTEHPRHDLPAWQELSSAYEQLTGAPPPQNATTESALTGSSHATHV